jgi:hypothetical protein
MPVRQEIDVGREVVVVVFSGEVTLAEVRANLEAFRRDSRVRPHFRTLVDCSEAVVVGSGFDDAIVLADFYRSANATPMTGRTALYAPQRNAVYGALRQFHAVIGEEGRMRVFTELAEARAWVGLLPA